VPRSGASSHSVAECVRRRSIYPGIEGSPDAQPRPATRAGSSRQVADLPAFNCDLSRTPTARLGGTRRTEGAHVTTRAGIFEWPPKHQRRSEPLRHRSKPSSRSRLRSVSKTCRARDAEPDTGRERLRRSGRRRTRVVALASVRDEPAQFSHSDATDETINNEKAAASA
jgi:hypothetical protein